MNVVEAIELRRTYKTTTGDALVSALQVLAIMKATGQSLTTLAAPMPKYPQILENVRVAKKIDVNNSPAIQGAVKQVEKRLNGTGRVVLRPSGTEPVIRVMVEADDDALLNLVLEDVAGAIERCA